jgi:putative cell wall-binding protein
VSAPVPDVTEPDAAGGADYAATVRGDAWDFATPGDVAAIGNAAEVTFSDGVLRAVNAGPSHGDPFVLLTMGAPIDTARFHRLTVRTALEGPFDLGFGPGGGSHGRLIYNLASDPEPRPVYDSKELIVYPGVSEYVLDLATDASETDSAVRPGWSGFVPQLRYDPNEDPGPRRWSIDEIALRADDETVDDAFDIVWRDASTLGAEGTTVALYADTDRAGFDGRLIAGGIAQQAGENRYRWDTRDWPAGRYHLYAVAERDGTVGRRYAGGPVVVGARLAGADRIATAVRLSQAAFPASAAAVVVASGLDFPDALAAAPVAAAAGGPLLLNHRDRLAPEVAAEIDRLGPSTVYLMGGEVAQSAAVEADLAARQGIEVVRLAGLNRYATASAAASEAVRAWREAGQAQAGGDVLVASGMDFPDALAAAPLAAAARMPLLLTDPRAATPETAAALDALNAQSITVVGGPAAVSDAALEQLGAGRARRRLGGANRHATALLLANEAAAAGADAGEILVANGRQFPDALAAGPVAAARGGVLLLSEREALPAETADFVRARAATLTWLRVAGGPAALAESVVSDLLRAAGR